MRIVAGRWRGRRLVAPEGLATRPTTDRVREALFSILGRRVDGAPVVDLCCGAGRHMVHLAGCAGFMAGLDYSRELLRLARAATL